MFKIQHNRATLWPSLAKTLFLFPLLSSLAWSPSALANKTCSSQFLTIERPTDGEKSPSQRQIPAQTLVEKLTQSRDVLLPAKEMLLEKIQSLEVTQPELAAKVRRAKEKREKNISLQVDFTELPQHMVNFIEGSYLNVIGKRGVSEPFIKFKNLDGQLLIEHSGDQFPMVVRWTSTVSKPQRADAQLIDGKTHIVLQLPDSMTSRKSLRELNPKYIFSLISGSHLNKYISSNQSEIMTIAGLLHDNAVVFDRPTQVEAKQLQTQLMSNPQLAKQIKSLLFVAPTGSGKTKVLIDSLAQQLSFNTPAQSTFKKLMIVTTKTPDLTGELAKEISVQLQHLVGKSKFRIIQWGGENSESMTHQELVRFIDNSDRPVVLVTSYPTLGTRSKGTASLQELLKRSSQILIDEAHNATGETFESFFKAATTQAAEDRVTFGNAKALSILGVTASPLTRTLRTSEIYDGVFWAGIDKVGTWVDRVKKQEHDPRNQLEWLRIVDQFEVARDRGEINAADPIFYRPEQRGFKFTTIFKRNNSGTGSSVNIERLKEIWPDIQALIADHGTGVIRTYPRDADIIAQTLSELSAKNFVSLQGLSVERRAEVYSAFKNGTHYKGKPVDAIVGRIQEGMDFPKAGWYLSFKKYVKFPESLQDPGRVVRIAINKVPPRIIFFGEEVDKTTYQDVKELVMNHLGKLPRRLPEGRLYSGAKVESLRKDLAESITEMNVSMEAFLRTQNSLLSQLGENGKFDQNVLNQLRQLLLEVRSEGANREITNSVNSFVAQVNGYTFFKGNLKDTWNFCDKLTSLARKGNEAIAKSKLSENEKAILADPMQMQKVVEFRSMFSAIGPVPRALLLEIDLRPMNMTELAKSVDRFVELNQTSPLAAQDKAIGSLAHTVERMIQLSADAFWRKLSLKSREALKNDFTASSPIRFEEIIEKQVAEQGRLPEFSFEIIDSPTRSAESLANNRLALELINNLKEGDVNVQKLSPQARYALVESEVFASLATKTLQNILKIREANSEENIYLQRLIDENTLNLKNLSRIGDFRFLKIVMDLATLQDSAMTLPQEILRRAESNLKQFEVTKD